MNRICKIDDCHKIAKARGWCGMHYMRWWAHGDPNTVLLEVSTSKEIETFLASALRYQGSECRHWPFATNNRGYPQINRKGRRVLVHRIVCTHIHGPAPTAQHEAAHSCGNGHLGCVTPMHLRWATRAENSADMITHGRSTRGRSMAKQPLNEEQVIEIFKRANAGESQSGLALEFGISQTGVSKIKRGATWGWLTAELVGVTPEALAANARDAA